MKNKEHTASAFLALMSAGDMAAAAAVAGKGSLGTKGPAVACSALEPPEIPGALTINMTATERRGVQYLPSGSDAKVDICDVQLFIHHPTNTSIHSDENRVKEEVRIAVWLPLASADNVIPWNGRYQGIGGSGWLAGDFAEDFIPNVALGYAAGSTDAGWGDTDDSRPYAQDPVLTENFAYRSMHDMTVAGQALTEQYYGEPPKYSYWNGCSTGGRQGYSEAQRYPNDYDGILAAAPAINWDRFIPAEFWPYLVQHIEADFGVSACKLASLSNASINACDLLDGARDGLISDPTKCDFDPTSVIGQPATSCVGNSSSSSTTTKITNLDVRVWSLLRAGPHDDDDGDEQLWYGFPDGADMTRLSNPPYFDIPQAWITDFLLDDPDFDVDAITTYSEYFALFRKSITNSTLHDTWATSNPDLSGFASKGGKLLTWHGWADELIFAQGTVDYWERVGEFFSTSSSDNNNNNDSSSVAVQVDDFYRVFMAPGVGHCHGGYGPAPTDPLAALVAWVEDGEAPETLRAGDSSSNRTRDLCRLPMSLRYKGEGNVEDAGSWGCE